MTSARTVTIATPATTALSAFSPNHPSSSYPKPTTTDPNAYPALTETEYALTPSSVCFLLVARLSM